jgi:hypothetical protein
VNAGGGARDRRRPRAGRSLAGALLAAAVAAPGARAADEVPPPAVPRVVDARAAGAAADGVRDDAPALQAALDGLAARGGVLHLAAGVYALGASLVVRGDGVTVRGDGAVLRAGPGFAAGAGPLVRGRTYRGEGGPAAQRAVAIVGLTLDGAGVAPSALWLERVRDAAVREVRVRGVAAGGAGAIVVRSTDDGENDTGEVTVADSVVELEQPTTGIVVRKVVNCRVSGNRVQGTGAEGGHGIDLTLTQGCTVTDNHLIAVDVGCLADESNHLQVTGNYVALSRSGFRAGKRAGGKQTAHNNVYVNNRVIAGGAGFVVHGSGMILVANYAAFMVPGPAIWVQAGGTHDAVVANNASIAEAGGIRFDASDGVVVANVPISNGTSGIEINGERVAVSANAIVSSPTGIRLGPGARACTVVGNTVRNAAEAALVLGGEGHRVRDNLGPAGGLPEAGPGAGYGSGETEVSAARTAVQALFADDRYVVAVEWTADPGGREWITDRTAAGFVIVLPAPPPAPVRARWVARGF